MIEDKMKGSAMFREFVSLLLLLALTQEASTQTTPPKSGDSRQDDLAVNKLQTVRDDDVSCNIPLNYILTHKCCYGRVVTKNSICGATCGLSKYNPLTYKCCYGKVALKCCPCPDPVPEEDSLDTPEEDIPCGKYFISLTKKCCYGRVVSKIFRCPPRCGSRPYNPWTHKCCPSKYVVNKRLPCPPLCGSRPYNPVARKCCFGRVVSKKFRCPPRCGSRPYNPWTHKCCSGKYVVNKRLACRSLISESSE